LRIIAYTDGSFSSNNSASASILMTTDTFLGLVIGVQKVGTPYDAELIGILQVLEYIEENKIEYDKLTIYTDVRNAAKKFKQLNGSMIVPASYKSKRKWKKILQLTHGKEVFIFHQKGHLEENNPNKTCDILARIHRECSTDL